jgi:hypothetical protein
MNVGVSFGVTFFIALLTLFPFYCGSSSLNSFAGCSSRFMVPLPNIVARSGAGPAHGLILIAASLAAMLVATIVARRTSHDPLEVG